MVRQRVGILEQDGGLGDVHGEKGWKFEVSLIDRKIVSGQWSDFSNLTLLIIIKPMQEESSRACGFVPTLASPPS